MKYPNIAAERARAGLTLNSLAEMLGVTRKTVYNWIQNGNIPQSALERLSEVFGCTIDYLLDHNT